MCVCVCVCVCVCWEAVGGLWSPPLQTFVNISKTTYTTDFKFFGFEYLFSVVILSKFQVRVFIFGESTAILLRQVGEILLRCGNKTVFNISVFDVSQTNYTMGVVLLCEEDL